MSNMRKRCSVEHVLILTEATLVDLLFRYFFNVLKTKKQENRTHEGYSVFFYILSFATVSILHLPVSGDFEESHVHFSYFPVPH